MRAKYIDIGNVLLKFELHTQSQNKVWETKKSNMAAILKGALLKIKRLRPIAADDMYMKFKAEIPKQTSCYAPETMPSKEAKKNPTEYRYVLYLWSLMSSSHKHISTM